MGQFSKDVRYNKLPGPNQRRFDRALWQAVAADKTLGVEDRDLARAGLYFDELLVAIRSDIALEDWRLSAGAIARLMVAVGMANMVILRDKTNAAPPGQADAVVHLSDALQESVELLTGDRFTPDEVLSALGDGLKHVLRDLMGRQDLTGESEYAAADALIDQVNTQLNVAILYNSAVAYWLDFVGHGYVLEPIEGGLRMRAADPQMEIARIVSAYRRKNIVLHHVTLLMDLWLHRLSEAQQRRLRGIPAVTKVFGYDRIERIDLGWDRKALLRGLFGVAERASIVSGPYQTLVDEPLPGLGGFSLRRLIDAWLVLQSLAETIYAGLRPHKEETMREILPLAPRVPARILQATLSRALGCPGAEAASLLDAFTFEGRLDQEAWTQPLVRAGEDFVLVTHCLVGANLQRIADVWLKQGAIDLKRKGPDFERYCIDELTVAMKGSELEGISSVLGPVTFQPTAQIREEIDLVLMIGDTVVILEAKCVLWPEESQQYANYRDTIDGAVDQVLRKRDRVMQNYPAFQASVAALGAKAPGHANVICAVLTNSPVYAGFPVRGVAITDLLILGGYFTNTLVKAEVKRAGKTVERHAIRFYETPSAAAAALAGYLQKPPQLDDAFNSVKARSITWPYEHDRLGKLVHETFDVQVDGEAVLERGRAASARESAANPRTPVQAHSSGS